VRILLSLIILLLSFSPLSAQSKTTSGLQEKFGTSLTLFFYRNTLRMLNQSDKKQFDELIKDIYKAKFVMIDKVDKDFHNLDYIELVKNYNIEGYELVLNATVGGLGLEIYLNDSKNDIPKSVIIYQDLSQLYILDIVGKIDISKAQSLFDFINNSTEVDDRIKGLKILGNEDSNEKNDE